ncbi:uncharacterized oxidoreductase [Yoonia tamlensis]|uniref:Uncharacterized oxidoreductase n=1 Tax=Yoonia tamlensis TaxID=390270 RepID=A0A1I6FU72_9RHOB|nr:SDR family NAD(P)-dependent oxidoreductase [Yoonia tamlensis]SFR33490.1 uncharacterized oxidoreductase [Yoonia tamlensis]
MQRELSGKTIVVTGATRGIGRALAGQLVAKGADVIGVARDQSALVAMAAKLGPAFTSLRCDLADPSDRHALCEALPKQIDGLINNAAIQIEQDYFTDPAPRDPSSIEIALNVTAAIALTTRLLVRLRQAPAPFVVNMTSGVAISPKERAPVYSATKAALSSFTTGFRYQAQTHCPQMTVAEVILPMVDTDMTAGRGSGKISPDQAAAQIIAGIIGGKHRIWVGKARLLPLLNRIAPRLVARMLR